MPFSSPDWKITGRDGKIAGKPFPASQGMHQQRRIVL